MRRWIKLLLVSILSVPSVQATPIYNDGDTYIDVSGSLRMTFDRQTSEVTRNRVGKEKFSEGNVLRNNDSRLNVTVQHRLQNNYYLISRVQTRFDKTEELNAVGSIYVKYAYAGIGYYKYGEVIAGRLSTPANEVGIGDFSNGESIQYDFLPTSVREGIRYNYRHSKDLYVSVLYGKDKGKRFPNETFRPKSETWQSHLTYNQRINNDTSQMFEVLVGRSVDNLNPFRRESTNSYLLGYKYQFLDLESALTVSQAKTKVGDYHISKYFISPGFNLKVNEFTHVYTNYLHMRSKSSLRRIVRTKGGLVGTRVQVHPKASVYVEYSRLHERTNWMKHVDSRIGTGVRIDF